MRFYFAAAVVLLGVASRIHAQEIIPTGESHTPAPPVATVPVQPVVSTTPTVATPQPAARTDKAIVCVYRPQSKAVGTQSQSQIFFDGKLIERIDNGTYFVVELPAGKHTFTAGDTRKMKPVEWVPGGKYYFLVEFNAKSMVFSSPMWTLTPMSEAKALKELPVLTHVQSIPYTAK
jgi:hypothetical protein